MGRKTVMAIFGAAAAGCGAVAVIVVGSATAQSNETIALAGFAIGLVAAFCGGIYGFLLKTDTPEG